MCVCPREVDNPSLYKKSTVSDMVLGGIGMFLLWAILAFHCRIMPDMIVHSCSASGSLYHQLVCTQYLPSQRSPLLFLGIIVMLLVLYSALIIYTYVYMYVFHMVFIFIFSVFGVVDQNPYLKKKYPCDNILYAISIILCKLVFFSSKICHP